MKTLKIVSKNLFDQKLQYSAPQKLSAAEVETARGLYQQWLGKSPSQKSDFIFVPKWEDCLNLAIDFRQRYSTLIVLGTGGSSLGAKSLISALKKSPSRDGSASKTVHFVENLDPSHIHKIIETCDLKQTAVALVSKSGKTLESTSAYLRIQAEFEKAGCKIYDHSIFIASKDNNPLFALSQRNNVPFLEIPQLTGGRFCIFTSAGLFPAAFAGIDLSQFCTRAHEVLSLET